MPVSFDYHLHISYVAFHGLFAGSDDRFEAKGFASRVLPRVGFAHRKLSDGPAKTSQIPGVPDIPRGCA
jgi:hypothetical protein